MPEGYWEEQVSPALAPSSVGKGKGVEKELIFRRVKREHQLVRLGAMVF